MVQPQTITVEYVHNRQCEYNLKPDVNTVLFFIFLILLYIRLDLTNGKYINYF